MPETGAIIQLRRTVPARSATGYSNTHLPAHHHSYPAISSTTIERTFMQGLEEMKNGAWQS
jgi:hypothetical protein